MIIRALFNKKNYLKYLSHLDLVRLFQRSFNRAGIPVKYSEGFNPHPKFSIAHPLSLGLESEGEYIDIELERDISAEDFVDKMNKYLPTDIQIVKAAAMEKAESVTSLISWAFYEVKFQLSSDMDLDVLREKIDAWLKQEEILITRLRKKGRNKVEVQENIVPMIGNVVVKETDANNFIVLNILLSSGDAGNLKPINCLEAMERDLSLEMDMDSILIKRLNLFAEKDGAVYEPM